MPDGQYGIGIDRIARNATVGNPKDPLAVTGVLYRNFQVIVFIFQDRVCPSIPQIIHIQVTVSRFGSRDNQVAFIPKCSIIDTHQVR